jgi:hypothetical protein
MSFSVLKEYNNLTTKMEGKGRGEKNEIEKKSILNITKNIYSLQYNIVKHQTNEKGLKS